MKVRDTLLGLVVLGLVAAGVFWARSPRSATEATPPSATTSPAAAPGGSSPAAPAAPAPPPDVTQADAAVDVNGIRVTLSVAPRPPVAFARTHFRVRVEARGVPVALEGGQIAFEMEMPMGDHRYTLVADTDGWLDADVVLPFCPSGNPRWYAIVQGTAAGQAITARFQLDLTKPTAAPSR